MKTRIIFLFSFFYIFVIGAQAQYGQRRDAITILHHFPATCTAVTTATRFVAIDLACGVRDNQRIACYQNGRLTAVYVARIENVSEEVGDTSKTLTISQKKPKMFTNYSVDVVRDSSEVEELSDQQWADKNVKEIFEGTYKLQEEVFVSFAHIVSFGKSRRLCVYTGKAISNEVTDQTLGSVNLNWNDAMKFFAWSKLGDQIQVFPDAKKQMAPKPKQRAMM